MPVFPVNLSFDVYNYEELRGLRIWASRNNQLALAAKINQLLAYDPRNDLPMDAPIETLGLSDQVMNLALQNGANTIGELIELTADDFCTRRNGGSSISRRGPVFHDLEVRLYVKTGYTLRGSRPPL